MAPLKYSDHIISTPKKVTPRGVDKEFEKTPIATTHLMTVDGDEVNDMFYVDALWLWEGVVEGPVSTPVEEPHYHDFDEVIALIGSDPDNPDDLHGEITFWLDGEKHVFYKTSLIYVPAGAAHGPGIFNRIEKPVLFVTMAKAQDYGRNTVSFKDAGKLRPKCRIITGSAGSRHSGGMPPPTPGAPLQSTHIINMDNGSLYAYFIMVHGGTGQTPSGAHTHGWEEVMGIAVCDRENPYDMGTGSISIAIGDDTYTTDKSALICIPRNTVHCPWKFHAIEKPTLVFVAGFYGR